MDIVSPALLTIGYEGRTVCDLVTMLSGAGVTVLVDVRLNPVSRKPGMSKRRLADHLEPAGIRYVHLPELGNPQDNRDALRAGDPAAVDRFRRLLRASPDALDTVASLTDSETVALLCLERSWVRCHRALVADELCRLRPGLTIRHR